VHFRAPISAPFGQTLSDKAIAVKLSLAQGLLNRQWVIITNHGADVGSNEGQFEHRTSSACMFDMFASIRRSADAISASSETWQS
jgi:hypothetical protein